MGCNMIEERGQILSCQKWANLCENVSEASLRNVRRNSSQSGNFTMKTFLFFWNRAKSLSTFMIRCKHFQWALLCSILQDTSVSLPDSPCVCTVLEREPCSFQAPFHKHGLLAPHWVHQCPAATDPARLMGLLPGANTVLAPLPQWSLLQHCCQLCRSERIFSKAF